jgi:hypothetical protein
MEIIGSILETRKRDVKHVDGRMRHLTAGSGIAQSTLKASYMTTTLRPNCLLMLLVAMFAMPSPTHAGGAGGGVAAPMDAAQLLQALPVNIKARLASTEAEWKKIEPLLTKVMKLRPLTIVPLTPPGQSGGAASRGGASAESPSIQAHQALVAAVRNIASDEEVAKALKNYLEVHDKAMADLRRAQKELQDAANAKQEAALVDLGYLD